MVDLLLTGLAAALWYLQPGLGPWPLALVAAGRVWRVLAARQSAWRGTRFDLPLLLFLLSAAIGAWLAFDRAAASGRFWLIVGGLALFDSIAHAPEQVRFLGRAFRPARAFFLVLPALIALYFLLTNDWAASLSKLPWLDPPMRWLASWQPAVPGHRLHPNVAGGLLAALLPVQIAAAGGALLGAPFVGLAAVGLLLTASRGAWLALAVVGAYWLLWRLWGHRWRRGVWQALVVLTILAAAAALAAAMIVSPGLIPGGRLDLLRNSLDLALDTPFTGLGLQGFPMAYSSYVLLLHVFHTVHSHNLPLNIWLEQGLLGLLAFCWLLVRAAQVKGPGGAWRTAAWAMLGVLLVHGLVDDAFYGSRGVLLLFLPFALLARDAASAGPGAQQARLVAEGRRAARGIVLAVAAATLLLPVSQAAFQANLGALSQTRAELAAYRWPETPLQDVLRRPGGVDPAPAGARFRAALALDPANVTANRRLGQIALANEEFAAARGYLEAAYRAAPSQRATRQLLGELAALDGDPTAAAALWQGLDLAAGQLQVREGWYGYLGQPARAEALRQAEALLEP